MAYISFLLVLLVLSFSCLTFASDLISDICPSTHNPSLCSKVLRSDPRSRGANLLGLDRVAIDIAQSNGKSILQLVKSLAQKTTDSKLKKALSYCSENFDDAISNFDDALKYLNSGDYRGVNLEASEAMDLADTCEDNFGNGKSATEPPQLKEASQKFQDLCSIIMAISNKL